jgi:hypothetical protein
MTDVALPVVRRTRTTISPLVVEFDDLPGSMMTILAMLTGCPFFARLEGRRLPAVTHVQSVAQQQEVA